MKFVKGKLYRVVKNPSPYCVGCVLKYRGADVGEGHIGKPVKLGESCQPDDWRDCPEFQYAINYPDRYKLVEHIDMIKFCKKLRKQLRKE